MQEKQSATDGGMVKEHKKSKTGLFVDRKRTNVLKSAEQDALFYLAKMIPGFITPNILTGIGFFGSLVVLASFVLGAYVNIYFLAMAIIGLAINWFGDSLDGRIAYFRNIPRKWYGFSLDIIMDWISTILMGLGFMIYATDGFEPLAYAFVVFYGWGMIIAQLRYKIADKYTIDSGAVGPTEVRFLIAFILILEIFIPTSINYCISILTIVLLIININETRKLLILGDQRDRNEKAKATGNEI
ncbi:MAG: CDP-alcohol phosphatidyltransferase family protein [Bacteroidota bacterium]